MPHVAIITGAGSGVGQASAVLLAEAGWRVALLGRREQPLRETASWIDPVGERALVAPCDIGDAAAVRATVERVLEWGGGVDVLVNAAGTNTQRRSLRELSLEDYQRVIDTNLNGAYYCVQAVLPAMRRQHAGTIVNIVSQAGRRPGAVSGAAYVVSKFGMAGLTEAINLEEGANGIRACSVFPGDINTPLLDLRPSPPPAEARTHMLQPQDVARCVLLAVTLPPRALVEEIVVRPR